MLRAMKAILVSGDGIFRKVLCNILNFPTNIIGENIRFIK